MGVELDAFPTLIGGEDDGAALHALTAEQREALLALAWTETERRFVLTKLAGGRRRELAEALGIGQLSRNEQSAEVHRSWRRLLRRFERRSKPRADG